MDTYIAPKTIDEAKNLVAAAKGEVADARKRVKSAIIKTNKNPSAETEAALDAANEVLTSRLEILTLCQEKLATMEAATPTKESKKKPLIVKAMEQAAEQGIPAPLPTWMTTGSAEEGIPDAPEVPAASAEQGIPEVPAALSPAERDYAAEVLAGDLREYLLSGTPEESVVALIIERLGTKPAARGIKKQKSACPNPCETVWTLASEMKGAGRSKVVAAAVAKGVTLSTARTQYQKWYEAGK